MPFSSQSPLLNLEVKSVHCIDTENTINLHGLWSSKLLLSPLRLSRAHRRARLNQVVPLLTRLRSFLPLCEYLGRRQAPRKPELESLQSGDSLLRS
jgi:hypothetical protein